MTFKFRATLPIVFPVFFGLLLSAVISTPGFAYDEPDRTANRSVLGYPVYPDWLFNKPDHYEFSPLVSNSDPLTQHPSQWDGQDWDTSKWGSQWTPEIAIQKFFNAHIFERQYLSSDSVPVVELGPTFYKISDLDQRRTLKLLSDQMAFFKKGYSAIKLVDWSTHDVVGAYTSKGMFLN